MIPKVILVVLLTQNLAHALNVQRRRFSPTSTSYVNFQHPRPSLAVSPSRRPSIRFETPSSSRSPVIRTTSSPFALRVSTKDAYGSTTLAPPLSSSPISPTTPRYYPSSTTLRPSPSQFYGSSSPNPLSVYNSPYPSNPVFRHAAPIYPQFRRAYIPKGFLLVTSKDELCQNAYFNSDLLGCEEHRGKTSGDNAKSKDDSSDDSKDDDEDIVFEYEDEIPKQRNLEPKPLIIVGPHNLDQYGRPLDDSRRLFSNQLPPRFLRNELSYPHRRRNDYNLGYRNTHPRILPIESTHGIFPHNVPNSYGENVPLYILNMEEEDSSASSPSRAKGNKKDHAFILSKRPNEFRKSPEPSYNPEISQIPPSTPRRTVLPAIPRNVHHPKLPPGYKIFEAVPRNTIGFQKRENLEKYPRHHDDRSIYDDIVSPDISFLLNSKEFIKNESFSNQKIENGEKERNI